MDHPKTWNQYQKARARQTSESHGCTIAAAMDCAPFWYTDWWSGVEEFVRDGGTLTAKFLNTLAQYDFRLLTVAANNAGKNEPFPPGYVFPHARANRVSSPAFP